MPLVGKLEKQLNEEQTQIIQKLQKYKYILKSNKSQLNIWYKAYEKYKNLIRW